jgi:hypothetical protein
MHAALMMIPIHSDDRHNFTKKTPNKYCLNTISDELEVFVE